MKKYRLYGSRTQDVSPLEKKNRMLARRAAEEGMVLLKNNGLLPLRLNQRIDLFGTGARMTVFGGSGSGETKGRKKITVEAGLINAGVNLTNTKWLDEFTLKYEREHLAWRESVEEAVKGYHLWNVIQMYEVIGQHPFRFPVGQSVTDKHISKDGEIAIYVIARQAGEGGDRKAVSGDYLLSDDEKNSIRLLKTKYKGLVLVINAGASIDLDILDEIDVDAVIFMGQPGEEAGNALANLLFGKTSFSGHLTSTWAKSISDYPYSKEYANNSRVDNQLEADYKEGIYVGYRYFDTKGIKPRFAFGHGLSYTTFLRRLDSAVAQGGDLVFDFVIKNAGDTYAGADVVQLYVSKPNGQINQVSKELCAFEKTKVLLPGQDEKCSIRVDIKELKTYVEGKNSFLLLAGEYLFFSGDSIENASFIGKVIVDTTVEVQQLCEIAGTDRFLDLKLNCKKIKDDDGFVINADIADMDGLEVADQTSEPSYFDESCRSKAIELADKFTDGELASLIVGANVTGTGYNRAPGAVGKTTNKLLKKYGMPNFNMADGPAGLNLLAENMITKGGMELAYEHLPEDRTWGFLKKIEWMSVCKKGRDIPLFQYTTAFPSTTVRASSWNKQLDYEIGVAVGEEMKAMGITLWLAPAINVQRNPLCGRNFEYASEDPYLSGKMAAAITNGVQSVGGVGVTIKHFCANNQETEREWVSSNISKRALREIYLRGFEIAIKESHPWAVMSSYNRLNGIYTGNHKQLLTDVLRLDFGFDGIVMTDWRAITSEKGSFALCAPAGNDIIMPGEPYVEKVVLASLKSGELDRDSARRSATRILIILFASNVWEVE